MIRSILKGATTLVALPILIPAYAVGGVLYSRLLKGQLRRSEAEVRRLRRELSDARADAATADAALADDREMSLLIANERDQARKWSSLWHGRARTYRGVFLNEYRLARDAETRIERLRGAMVDAVAQAIAIEREDRAAIASRLEALRGAVAEALRFIAHSQKHRDRSPETLIWNTEVALQNALATDGSAPQGQPMTAVNADIPGAGPTLPVDPATGLHASHPKPAACPHGVVKYTRTDEPGYTCRCCGNVKTDPLCSGFVCRQCFELGGDHYPADEKIQGWAAALEHVTRERDALAKQREADTLRLEAAWAETNRLKAEVKTLNGLIETDGRRLSEARNEVRTLRRELKQADEDHDRALNERTARHREVLAERDAIIARLKGGARG